MSESGQVEKFEVTITYLEMLARSTKPLPPRPPYKTALMRVEKCPAAFYRFLYDYVGAEWYWVQRRYMSDEELLPIIHDEEVYLYCLYVEGAAAGMAEIDARDRQANGGAVEIKYFGLGRDFMGKSLGKWFLANVIDLAWDLDPAKLVIETCSKDHPAALRLYQKHGFTPSGQGNGIIEWRG